MYTGILEKEVGTNSACSECFTGGWCVNWFLKNEWSYLGKGRGEKGRHSKQRGSSPSSRGPGGICQEENSDHAFFFFFFFTLSVYPKVPKISLIFGVNKL